MNFRNIALITLLLPMASYGKSIEARIKELKEAQFKKELEVDGLGKMIEEKEELLRNFDQSSQLLLELLVDKKLEELKTKNNYKQLSNEEVKEFTESIRNSVNTFMNDFGFAYKDKKNIKNLLIEGLFNQDNLENIKEFESLKFFLIRCAFARGFLVKIIEKYEIAIHELISIDQELSHLEK